MRIAVLCGDLGIRVPGTKGASLHLQAISSGFAELGHEVLLIGVQGHGAPPAGIQSLLLPHPGRTSGLRREIRKLRFMSRLAHRTRATLDVFQPEVVYERLALFGASGRAIADRHGAAHVIEVNALLAREDARWRGLRLGGLATRRECAALAGADLRVAVSDEVAQAVQDVAPGGPVIVVANGVDVRMFATMPPRRDARVDLGLDDDLTWLGFSGSLRPWHGLDRAIDALSHLPGTVHLAVAGDGPVRAQLEDMATRRGVGERVRFVGHLPHASMPTFLAAIDIALAPYPPSGDFSFSPLKVYEYLAAGAPTIASDIGQLHHLLDQMPGSLRVPPGDVPALADAVCAVMAEQTAWNREAAKARAHVLARHSWEHRAAQIVTAVERTRAHALAV